MSKILVIDDEYSNRELLEAILSLHDYKIITAKDGQEGLETVTKEWPDLILLDVMMPKLTGYEVCQRLKRMEKTAPIPIIMLTSLTGRSEKLKGIEAGANDFLNKPIDEEELLLRIRNALYTKNLYDQLQKNYIKLEKMEKLRDSLTKMIVHDMRSPLMGISGHVQLVEMQLQDVLQPKHYRFLRSAKKSISLLLNMINSLLDVGKLEEGKLQIHRELRQCWQLIEAAKEILLLQDKCSQEGPSFCFHCDPELTQRVLINLLSNAQKYNPPEEKILIRSCEVEGGNKGKITIIDQGPGIAPEHQQLIFEKFSQVELKEQKVNSTGLGLAFCKLAIEAQGGEIGVESTPGQGAEFWFTLPLASNP